MPNRATGEPRVLVVDDSQVARQVIAMTCRQIPALLYATIDQAPDGAVALECMRSRKYILALADVRMPNVDGLEFVRRVREELGDRKTPIVLISTLATEDAIQRGIEAGATAYLAKPLSPFRIRLLIERLLAGRT